MGLGLLLIPSLGGYWFLQHANFTRYEIHRLSGYHLLFRSAMAGIVLAAFAHAFVLIVNQFVPELRTVWRSYVAVDYLDTAVVSLVLALVLPPIINRFDSRKNAARRTAERYGDLMELIISDSIEQQKMIELSLKTGKSYIGYAINNSITKPGASDVAVTPVASGYRSGQTHELHLTTHYAPVIKEWYGGDSSKDEIVRDFRIVISREEIASVRLFAPNVYLLFLQHR